MRCRPAVLCCPSGLFQLSPMARVMSRRDEKLSCEAYFWAPSSCTPLYLSTSLPPALLHLHFLPPFPLFLTFACRSESCQLPLSQRSVPISALCSPLSLCVSVSFIALSLSHSMSMQHPSSSFHRSALSHPYFSPSLLPCLLW